MLALLLTLALVAVGVSVWRRRPSPAEGAPPAGLEHWPVVDDGLHSSSTTARATTRRRYAHLYIDYYTSHIDRDWLWLLAMFLPTEIRMAELPLEQLRGLSKSRPSTRA